MKFYMSGTPRNDAYQNMEDELCDYRLFSLHGDYRRAVLRWIENIPEDRDLRKAPRHIMLDSGAFTAWNKGHKTSVDEVIDSYSDFIERAGKKLDSIVAINLDVIPGERGRDPSPDDLKEAVKVSDENYKILTERFGNIILPVYHQGEPVERLKEVEEQASYICISPRNDLHEELRIVWSAQAHAQLNDDTTTHGLATTGNKMLGQVPWYSADSAAWVLHGGFGKVDLFLGNKYVNVFVSDEGGKNRYHDQHYSTYSEPVRCKIDQRVLQYGYTMDEVRHSGRIRGLINMGELLAFADYINETGLSTKSTQGTLFGV